MGKQEQFESSLINFKEGDGDRIDKFLNDECALLRNSKKDV